MGLSDELLAHRSRLRKLRDRVASIVKRERALGGFLVDEEGALFAAAGNIELPLSHPVAGLSGAGSDALLRALVGERPEGSSRYVVVSVGDRALFTLVHASPLERSPERSTRKRLREDAKALRAIVEGRSP